MTTSGRTAPAALAILALWTISCSGDGTAPLAPSPTVDVSGAWNASWTQT